MTAADYLESSLYDFYIDVFAYDYRVDNLTDDERQHLMDSLESIEEAIQETYGEYADYKIYLDGEHKAEFTASKG